MSDWNQQVDAGMDFAEVYTAKTQTPKHRTNEDQSQLYFSPSPHKPPDSSGDSFCSKQNFEQSLSHLNQELTVLGFSSLYHDTSDTFDVTRLVNITYDLFQCYQRSSRIREDMENRQHRTESDISYLQLSQTRLKESLKLSQRDITQLQEKERQLLKKMKSSAVKLKDEKEEVKRLQSVIQHRDLQYKHDLKKKEREMSKLKERMHKLLTDKNQERRIGMDILNALQRADGRRSTWKTRSTNNRQEEEMYRLLITSYEDRQKQIMAENHDLRQSLADMQRELVTMLNGQPSPSRAGSSLILNESYGENDTSISTNSPSDLEELSEGHFQMPYDMVRDDIHKSLKEKWKLLKEKVRKIEKIQDCQNILNGGTHSEDSKSIEMLQHQISKYWEIIQQQESIIQQTFQQSPDHSISTTFLDDSDFVEDKEKFNKEKSLFQRQKVNFEEERRQFTEATIKLSQERKAFEAEKASLLSQQFMQMTPFTQNGSRKFSGTPTFTPSTPVFSAAPDRCPSSTGDMLGDQSYPGEMSLTSRITDRSLSDKAKLVHTSRGGKSMKPLTPSTGELYKRLGLKYSDDETSSLHSSGRHFSSSRASLIKPVTVPTNQRLHDHMDSIKMALFQKLKEKD